MVEISGSFIGQIYNTGVDFVKTIKEKGIREGISQLGSKILESCKNITVNMSNGFSSIPRSVKQVFKPFLLKFLKVSSGQKEMNSENTFVNGAIDKLKEMGVKKDILKFLRTGVDKSGHQWFDVKNSMDQKRYIRNALVDKAKQDGTITKEAFDTLKNQSLEEVLKYFDQEINK